MLPRKQTPSQLAHVLCNNAILQITYRSMDRTLTDVEVDAMQVGQFKLHVSSPWLPACIPDGSPPACGSQLGPGAALGCSHSQLQLQLQSQQTYRVITATSLGGARVWVCGGVMYTVPP